MENKIYILLLSIFLCSCYHSSELKSEKGVVIEKQYSPEFNAVGTSVGYSSSGHAVFVDNSIKKDEQFIVVFKCQHGVVFSVNRNNLYATLEKGDSVLILFNEVLNSDNEIKYFNFKNAFKR